MYISAFGLCVFWKLANLKDLIRERENIELLTFFLEVFSSSVLADWAVLSCSTWNKIGLGRWHFDISVVPFYFFKSNDRHGKWFTT